MNPLHHCMRILEPIDLILVLGVLEIQAFIDGGGGVHPQQMDSRSFLLVVAASAHALAVKPKAAPLMSGRPQARNVFGSMHSWALTQLWSTSRYLSIPRTELSPSQRRSRCSTGPQQRVRLSKDGKRRRYPQLRTSWGGSCRDR